MTCTCHPCTTPAYGAPGYGHCAACCYGTGIDEYDPQCLVAEHADMGRRQFPEVVRVPFDEPPGFDEDAPF